MRRINTIIYIIPFAFLFCYNIVFSQTPTISKKEFYFMKGNIGGSAITMYLYIKGNRITGKYYYDSIKQFIDINGNINGDTFYINEFVNNNKIASLNGKVTENMFFSGDWISSDLNNKHYFNFSRYSSSSISKATIINSSLKIDLEGSGKFDSSRDAVVIENQIKSKVLDKISVDVDGVKSLDENGIADILSKEIIADYNNWKNNLSLETDINVKREIKISYLDDKIISFAINNYSFVGGVHGIDTSVAYIYSISTGNRIGVKLSELISNPSDMDLINLIRNKLLINYSEKDFFDFNAIELSDTFDITPTGIRFIYPVYKIAGYSLGIIEIEFTFSELKPFIKSNSPFFYLFE